MPTLIDNLNLINSYKRDIKSAIENKGVDMTGVSFGSYADKIGEIETGGTFVTETLSVSVNNTYYPGQGVDGFSQVIVDVPQNVEGYTQREITERTYNIPNVNNSASYVAYQAFTGNSTVETVYLPNCKLVSTAGFDTCSNLTTVSLPVCESVGQNAFNYCRSLTSIDIPNLKNVGYGAFQTCTLLTSIYFPKCTYVSQNAFLSCTRVVSIDLPVCSYFGPGAAARCYSLESVSLPECYFLGDAAFGNCSKLTSVYLPKCVGAANYTFSNCYVLSELSLPCCMTIGISAFSGSLSLFSQLWLGTEVYGVKSYPFSNANCPLVNGVGSIYVHWQDYSLYDGKPGWFSISSRLVSVGEPGEYLLSYSEGLVYGSTKYLSVDYFNYLGINRQSVKNVDLPDCFLMYGNGAQTPFYQCSSLKTVNLPALEILASSTFVFCWDLERISIPNCKSIGNTAFWDCNKLKSIDLPVCEYIGQQAFYPCGQLSFVTIGGSSVCRLGGNAVFSSTIKVGGIYVPYSLVEDYKVAQYWSSLSNNIFAILDDFMYSDGLVFGWATSMGPDYLSELSISAADVTGISMSRLTTLSSSTFMDHINLVDVDIPIVSEYPDDTFNGCSALSEVGIQVSVLGNRVYANCTGLESVNIEYVGMVSAGSDLFLNCPNLSQITVPYGWLESYQSADGWSQYSSLMVEGMPWLSFSDGLVFGAVTSIYSSYITTLGITSNQVVSVSLPNCTYVGVYTFKECHSLKDVYLPKCEYVDTSAFYGANYINGVDLPVCSYIGNYAFYWCNYSMSYIKLESTSVCVLGGPANNVFYNTLGSFKIYVPSSLVDSYKAAQNWSAWSNKIYPIPE